MTNFISLHRLEEKIELLIMENKKFQIKISQQINFSTKPIIFVESDEDYLYINKACHLLGKKDLMKKITFVNATNHQNLDYIWHYIISICQILIHPILLLYSCDQATEICYKNKIVKNVIPYQKNNFFDRGIENLFPKESIKRAMQYKSAFIDYTFETVQIKNGQDYIIPEKYEINMSERKELCQWLCDNGTVDDYLNFKRVSNIIEAFLEFNKI